MRARGWARLRRVGVSSTVLVVSTFVAPRPAAAAEDATPSAAPRSFSAVERVQAYMVSGSLDDARAELAGSTDVADEDERAVLDAFASIIERWSMRGGRPRGPPKDRLFLPSSDAEHAFARSFSDARALLVVGEYARAERRFVELEAHATTSSDRAVTTALRSAAHDLAALAGDRQADEPRVERGLEPSDADSPSGIRATTGIRGKARWYGRQIQTCDLLVLVYPFCAPVVHLSHGRGDAALASFALRAGVPSTFALVGVAARDEVNPFGLFILAGISMVAISLVDAYALAYEPRRPSTVASAGVRVTWTGLGAAGTF